jgi:NUMOD3 motif
MATSKRYRHTEAARAKISAAQRGRTHSADTQGVHECFAEQLTPKIRQELLTGFDTRAGDESRWGAAWGYGHARVVDAAVEPLKR